MASSLPFPRKTQEDILCWHALHLRNRSLQFQLQWVRVAVEWLIIGVLIRIEKHPSLPPSVLIPCRTIWSQAPDILSGKFF